MGFIEMVMGAYGIRPTDKTVADKLKESDRNACKAADGSDDAQCLADFEAKIRQGKAFDDMHRDLMRKSRVDQAVNRFQMVMTVYRAIPSWLKVMMFVFMVVAMLLAVIPGLMILVELLSNRTALFKVAVMCLFVVLVVFGYYMLPL